MKEFLNYSILFIVSLVVLFVGLRVLFLILELIAVEYYKKHVVHYKILLPRNDSQKDRQEETEKDFREKIGIMSQFYRSLHELRELDIMNRVKVYLFGIDVVSLQLVCRNGLIEFHISTYEHYKEIVEKQVTSYYSSASIDVTTPPVLKKKGYHTRSYFAYLVRPFWYPAKMYKEIESDPLNGMTNTLSKLTEDEVAVIQLMLRPKSSKWQKEANEQGTQLFKGEGNKSKGILSKIPGVRILNSLFVGMLFGPDDVKGSMTNAPGANSGDHYVRMLQADEERAKNVGTKSTQVGYETTIRIFTMAKTKSRSIEIANNIFVGFNIFKDASSNWFQIRRMFFLDFINNRILTRNYKDFAFKLGEKTSILVPDELANIFHFPDSIYNDTPSIEWLKYKVLPVPVDMPTEGIWLGNNTYRGVTTPVKMLKDDRSRHFYIIGKSGSGKSVFLTWMARQDIKAGEGLCVIDPHGDLIEDCLNYVPKERAKDVIVFDPSNQDRPMGLNILETSSPDQMDMASSQATEIFIKLFGDEIFGPRIQHYFRNACLTLMENFEEGATLIDVPRMFTDEAFMQYKTKNIKNPVVRSFWEHEYANTGQRERQEMIPYFSAKFGPFITNSIMRNTIGQTKSAFNLREIMDTGKILLINLSKGKIGDLNTQLLGLVLVSKIQMAAMSRADMLKDERKDFFLYVDEFQNFATDSFASILSEARKYKLNLIMAHQYINQLVVSRFGTSSTQIRDAIFGNVGTMMSFKIGAEDAEYLAKEYAPALSEQDVINIANYRAYMKLNIKNTTSRPFSMETIYDPEGANPKLAQLVKEYSSMKYGRKREFVEQEIGARIGYDF
jgi:hypothetical protein